MSARDPTEPVAADRSCRIGDSVLRVEDERLLRGLGRFLDDIEPGGTVFHAGFVRSPHAHARIRAVDAAAAERLPGVVGVLSAKEIDPLVKPIRADFDRPGFKPTSRPVLARDRVRFVGDAVALVLARDPYLADDAAELVEVAYEPLAPVITLADALAPGAPRVHEEIADNVLFEGRFASDGFEAALAGCEHRLIQRFSASRVTALALEPRGCIAHFDRGTGLLTVWSSTQVPHLLRNCLIEHLRLAPAEVRVVAPDVGGGFGAKMPIYPEELVLAAAAMKYGVSVKWSQDRADDFLSTAQARDHVYELEIGFDRAGRIGAVRADIAVNVGAYAMLPAGSSLESNGAGRNLPGPYKIRNFAYRTRSAASNTCPTGAYRGVAGPLAFFAMEGMLDRMARRLGLDPAEIRRRNLVDTFPYVNVLGQAYEGCCFGEALERALATVRYDALRRQQREGAGGRFYRGIGIACITEQTGMGSSRYKARGILRVPGFETAFVKVEPDGRVVACISQAAQGQGHQTAFGQIVSEQLGVPLRKIRIVEADTAVVPFGTGTFASRGVVIAGGAVHRATRKLREKILRIAAHLLECSAADLRLENGQVHISGVPEPRLTIDEIAAVAYALDGRNLPPGEDFGLEVLERFDTPTAVVASAAHVASVTIDAHTGNLAVDRYVVVHDCGRMINPMLVDGQIHGAVSQGLGEVLMERIFYDRHGQLQTANLLDYQIPRAVDVPAIEVEAVHAAGDFSETNFKGVGESGTMGSVPALANAIGDALAPLGISIDRLPMRAADIRAAIAAALARGAG